MDHLDGVLEGAMDFDSILLATEVLEPYVLTWTLGQQVDGEAECTVLAIMKREGGVLLAMPNAFPPESVIAGGNAGDEGATFGPSMVFTVPSVIMEDGIVSITGEEIQVLVIDCLPDVVGVLRRFTAGEDIIYGFDDDSPYAFPSIDALLPLVRRWLAELPDLAAFYTPDEHADVEASPVHPEPKARRGPARKASASGDGQKQKRPTTATLASELKSIVEALPKFSQQIAQISERQTLMEAQLMPVPATSSAVARPSLTPALAVPQRPSLGSLAKSMGAPPRTAAPQTRGTLATMLDARPTELKALELEKQDVDVGAPLTDGPSLAAALLEQSRAISTLAAQIAQGTSDPMTELAGSVTTGTRGAAGRAKLQAELASHKGLFFAAVMQSMARRMSPTSNAEVSQQALLDRGVSGLRYLERFGGYSRQRELGQLQFQVMTAFDYLMEDNIPAVKDTIALLAVTIEQSCLDNGRMELATLLCLQEDPPAAIFQNRQLSATSRARSFAPLADQRWITCALAFLKEMEVITTKRAELTASGRWTSEASSDPQPRAKAKPAAKRKGKGKGNQPAEEGDAQQSA